MPGALDDLARLELEEPHRPRNPIDARNRLRPLWSEKKLLARPFVCYRSADRGVGSRGERVREEILEALERTVWRGAEAVDGRRARGDRTRQAILDAGGPDRLRGGARGPLDRPARDATSASARAACSPTSARRPTSSSRPSTPRARSSSSEVIGGSRAGLRDRAPARPDRRLARLHGAARSSAAAASSPPPRSSSTAGPGPVRDRIASMMGEWLLALEAAIQDAQDAGELPPDIDSEQLAFEINSLGHGRQLGVPALPRRGGVRPGAGGDPRAAAVRASRTRCRRSCPDVEVDEGAARRSLREQIAKLERELAALFASAYPRRGARLAGQLARRPARARTSATSRRCATSLPTASRRPAARSRARAESSRQNRERIEALVADPAQPQVAAHLERGHRRARLQVLALAARGSAWSGC